MVFIFINLKSILLRYCSNLEEMRRFSADLFNSLYDFKLSVFEKNMFKII